MTVRPTSTITVVGDGDPQGKYGKCRSCGAEIVWHVTAKNRRPIPMNPDYTVTRAEREAGEQTAQLVGTSHFATCPHAAEHRRSR
jgi:hypothetical protein